MMRKMNILVFTILVATVSVRDAASFVFRDDSISKCIPNRPFIYDHNRCGCNNDGTEMNCQKNDDSYVKLRFSRMQLQNLTLECVPKRTFNFGCQKCLCEGSGKYATCVRNECTDKDRFLDKPERCIPGSVFDVDCNGCICGADGKAACTKLSCVYGGKDKPECVPGSEFMDQCNFCSCASKGEGLCDRMGCSPGFQFWHESVLNVTMSCDAKKIFDYNCHQCLCGDDGRNAICSGKPGNCSSSNFDKPMNTKERCLPGMIFGDGCNVCVCGDNGKGVCTTVKCNLH